MHVICLEKGRDFILMLCLLMPHSSACSRLGLEGLGETRTTVIITIKEIAHLVLAVAHLDQEVLVLHSVLAAAPSVLGITTTICNRVSQRRKASQTLFSEDSAGL